MKKFIIICLTLAMTIQLLEAQISTNKGNRLQSYPDVTEVDSDIQNLINQVNIDTLVACVQWMQDLGCRDAQSNEALITQNWLIDKFESYGYDTYVQLFTCDSRYIGYCTETRCSGDTLDAGNVIATKLGSEFPDEIIIISAHYDHPDGPGADDNASGTAGVVECARLLQNVDTKRTIMFIPFNGEEYWMEGSGPFAEKCAEEHKNIIGVFNLDMIGFFPENHGKITMSSGYSPISESLWNYYSQVANLYLPAVRTFRFSDGDSYGGDHMPFNIYEYPALYIGDIEYSDLHPCYHQLCDSIGHGLNNFDLFQSFVQATMAAVTELANGWLPPQNFAAIPADECVKLSWNHSAETSSYKVFKNGEFFAETNDTLIVDNEVVNGLSYQYYVVAVNSNNGKDSNESNHDVAIPSEPLQLPYFNDFENNYRDFNTKATNNSWTLTNKYSHGGSKSFTNTTNSYLPDNYLATAELNWFSIPDTIVDISVDFYCRALVTGIWDNAHLYFEVTTDRVNWIKLETISGSLSWWHYSFSLNDFIGAPFLQFRFRIETSGTTEWYYDKVVYIDDFSITYKSNPTGIDDEYDGGINCFNVSPNPSTGEFTITTGYKGDYNLQVFDTKGVNIYNNSSFSDGVLNLTLLQDGVYLIKISDYRGDGMVRKIVVKH